jgi:ornithine carbamoyltransferase
MQHRGQQHALFPNATMAMIFEKASTRTRVSFEAGMAQFGGHALFLSPNDTQLGRGEPIQDTAKVISRMVDIVMIRTSAHERLEVFAKHSKVPVINALSDESHPCQLLADMMTWYEHRGDMQGKTATWIGDGNNMCHSFIRAAHLFGFHLNIACPEGYDPDQALLDNYAHCVTLMRDPLSAAKGADLLATDVWASMGQEQEAQARIAAFEGFELNSSLLQVAKPGALYLHCLPAHRGEEISAELMDDENSVIWDEAENRLHAQKALIEFLLRQK